MLLVCLGIKQLVDAWLMLKIYYNSRGVVRGGAKAAFQILGKRCAFIAVLKLKNDVLKRLRN